MPIDIIKLNESTTSIFKTLQTYFGIGPQIALSICQKFGVSPSCSANFLPSSKLNKIKSSLEKMTLIENKLRFVQNESVQRLILNKSYRGVRLNAGLPVRGQRTQTNGRTQKKRPIKLQHKEE